LPALLVSTDKKKHHYFFFACGGPTDETLNSLEDIEENGAPGFLAWSFSPHLLLFELTG